MFIHDWRGNGSQQPASCAQQRLGLSPAANARSAGKRSRCHEATRWPAARPRWSQPGWSARHAATLACRRRARTRLWLVASGSPYWRAFPPADALVVAVGLSLPAVAGGSPWLPPGSQHRLWRERIAQPDPRLGAQCIERAICGARNRRRTWKRRWRDSDRRERGGASAGLAGASEFEPLSCFPSCRAHAIASSRSMRSALEARADHFEWMKRPNAVIESLLQPE